LKTPSKEERGADLSFDLREMTNKGERIRTLILWG